MQNFELIKLIKFNQLNQINSLNVMKWTIDNLQEENIGKIVVSLSTVRPGDEIHFYRILSKTVSILNSWNNEGTMMFHMSKKFPNIED